MTSCPELLPLLADVRAYTRVLGIEPVGQHQAGARRRRPRDHDGRVRHPRSGKRGRAGRPRRGRASTPVRWHGRLGGRHVSGVHILDCGGLSKLMHRAPELTEQPAAAEDIPVTHVEARAPRPTGPASTTPSPASTSSLPPKPSPATPVNSSPPRAARPQNASSTRSSSPPQWPPLPHIRPDVRLRGPSDAVRP